MHEAMPNVVLSKCIEFDYCRYNGLIIASEFVKKLKEHVNFIPICPEVEIGLGTPRSPVRLVQKDGGTHLVQPETGRDVTSLMNDFSQVFLSGLEDIDGFILKGRSPSCGVKEAKIYSRAQGGHVVTKAPGLFASKAYELFPQLPIEDELRTKNHKVREHFLTQLYTFARFRECKRSRKIRDLVEFQSINKYLFMAYNQSFMRSMGKLAANQEDIGIERLLADYSDLLFKMLEYPPRYTSHINVIMHLLGYFKEGLDHAEKSFLLGLITQYRDGKLPLSAIQSVIWSWAFRFNDEYLLKQTYLSPYPRVFMEPLEEYREKDYWKHKNQ